MKRKSQIYDDDVFQFRIDASTFEGKLLLVLLGALGFIVVVLLLSL